MKLDIQKERQMAIIWAGSDENTDVLPPEITEQLAPLKAKYSRFKVIIMRSGSGELFEHMLTLLLRNRMKKALSEVRAENEQQDRTAV